MQKLLSQVTGKTSLEFIVSSVRAASVVQSTAAAFPFSPSKACSGFFFSILVFFFPKIERELRQQSSGGVSLLSACHCSVKFRGMLPFRREECRILSGRCSQSYIFVLATSCLPGLLRCLVRAAGYCAFILFLLLVLNLKKEGGKKKSTLDSAASQMSPVFLQK